MALVKLRKKDGTVKNATGNYSDILAYLEKERKQKKKNYKNAKTGHRALTRIAVSSHRRETMRFLTIAIDELIRIIERYGEFDFRAKLPKLFERYQIFLVNGDKGKYLYAMLHDFIELGHIEKAKKTKGPYDFKFRHYDEMCRMGREQLELQRATGLKKTRITPTTYKVTIA